MYSVDGMPGKRAGAAEQQLARIFAAKWEPQYSDVHKFVQVCVALSIVRSNSLLLRADRDKGI